MKKNVHVCDCCGAIAEKLKEEMGWISIKALDYGGLSLPKVEFYITIESLKPKRNLEIVMERQEGFDFCCTKCLLEWMKSKGG